MASIAHLLSRYLSMRLKQLSDQNQKQHSYMQKQSSDQIHGTLLSLEGVEVRTQTGQIFVILLVLAKGPWVWVRKTRTQHPEYLSDFVGGSRVERLISGSVRRGERRNKTIYRLLGGPTFMVELSLLMLLLLLRFGIPAGCTSDARRQHSATSFRV